MTFSSEREREREREREVGEGGWSEMRRKVKDFVSRKSE